MASCAATVSFSTHSDPDLEFTSDFAYSPPFLSNKWNDVTVYEFGAIILSGGSNICNITALIQGLANFHCFRRRECKFITCHLLQAAGCEGFGGFVTCTIGFCETRLNVNRVFS